MLCIRFAQFLATCFFFLALCIIIGLVFFSFSLEVLVNCFGYLYISGAKRSHRDTELCMCKRLILSIFTVPLF